MLMYGEHNSHPSVTTTSSSSTSPRRSTSPPGLSDSNQHGELCIRRSRNTSSGTYHTFTTRPKRSRGTKRGHSSAHTHTRTPRDDDYGGCRLTKTLSPSDTDRLACSFGSLLLMPGTYHWVWGNWSQYIPQRIGNSVLLDLSVVAMMASFRSRLAGTEVARKEALLTYGRALHMLKDDIAVGKSAVTGDLIAAMVCFDGCCSFHRIEADSRRSSICYSRASKSGTTTTTI